MLVALVTVAVAEVARDLAVPPASLNVLYIAAVVLSAIWGGAAAGAVASVAAFLAVDVLFVEPRHTLRVGNPAEWVTLLVLLGTGLITGQLASMVRRRTEEARASERSAATLYLVGRAMSAEPVQTALAAAADILRSAVDAQALVIAARHGGYRVESGDPRVVAALEAAQRAGAGRMLTTTGEDQAGLAAPRGSVLRVLPAAGPLDAYLVQAGPHHDITIAFAPEAGHPALDGATGRLLLGAADDVAEAVDRARLRNEAAEVEALRRADELRTVLLNTVSHDLRTPLAAIVAAADSLRSDIEWDAQDRREFVDDIAGEARRLDEIVRHLLDMSRIQGGALQLLLEWHDAGSAIGDQVRRLRASFPTHRIVFTPPHEPISVLVDSVALGEVIANLVENACRHTPDATTVGIEVRREQGTLEIEVHDDGPGIPGGVLPDLFQPFARARGLRDRHGTGLGLAVANALVEAHGGTLSAESAGERGTRFTIRIPQPAVAPAAVE